MVTIAFASVSASQSVVVELRTVIAIVCGVRRSETGIVLRGGGDAHPVQLYVRVMGGYPSHLHGSVAT